MLIVESTRQVCRYLLVVYYPFNFYINLKFFIITSFGCQGDCVLQTIDSKTLAYESATLEFWLDVYFFVVVVYHQLLGEGGAVILLYSIYLFSNLKIYPGCVGQRVKLIFHLDEGIGFKYSGIVPYLCLIYVNMARIVPSEYSVCMPRSKGEIGDTLSFNLVQFLRSLRESSPHCVSLAFKLMCFHVTWPLNASLSVHLMFT